MAAGGQYISGVVAIFVVKRFSWSKATFNWRLDECRALQDGGDDSAGGYPCRIACTVSRIYTIFSCVDVIRTR
jgi:hypothetical protein